MSAFLKGSSFLVNPASGAMVVKDGYEMTGPNSVITFADGSTQSTAPTQSRAGDFTWSVAPTALQQTLASGYATGATAVIPKGTSEAVVGGKIYEVEMTITLGGSGQIYADPEAITQYVTFQLTDSTGTAAAAPVYNVGTGTVTRGLQASGVAGGPSSIDIFVNTTVNLALYSPTDVYDQLTLTTSAFSSSGSSISTVRTTYSAVTFWINTK